MIINNNNVMRMAELHLEMSKILIKQAYQLKIDNRHDSLKNLLAFYKVYKNCKEWMKDKCYKD